MALVYQAAPSGYHLLAMHESRLQSAYLAGWGSPLWTKGDAKEPGSMFGADPDMDSAGNAFELNVQLADLALAGFGRGVDLAFAFNAREGARAKAGVMGEVWPLLRKYSVTFEPRGDDPDGDGVSRLASPLCHEYALDDLLEWLAPRLTASTPPRQP